MNAYSMYDFHTGEHSLTLLTHLKLLCYYCVFIKCNDDLSVKHMLTLFNCHNDFNHSIAAIRRLLALSVVWGFAELSNTDVLVW